MTRPALPPALLIHGAGELARAVEAAAGHPFALLSPEAAGGAMGPRTWLALAARAPGHPALLCCGGAPGHALAALRAGCRALVLRADAPGFAALAGAAEEAGALLLPARPPALDLRPLDLRRPAGRARLLAWLCMPPPDDRAAMLG